MSGFTEGIYIDKKSLVWKDESVFDVVNEVDEDPQLIDIEGQVHERKLRDANQPDDIFPNSIIVVRENVLDTILNHFRTVMGGHRFPSRACLVVLKDRSDPAVPKQLKRNVGVNARTAANCTELQTIIKGHLNEMDPAADEGVQNLREFEEEVCDISVSEYTLIPENLNENHD
jgi:hypothetical protein